MDYFNDKRILVTGCCGTVGYELIKQLCQLGSCEVIGIDNNETELFLQKNQLETFPGFSNRYCDIRDKAELNNVVTGIDVLFHSAAMKHVGVSETAPNQAIATNILGIQNLIDVAIFNRVEKFLFTSSDKAVNPTNVMGATKLLGERMVTAASRLRTATAFASTRFGNVLGSRGSVLPVFQEQIVSGHPLSLTDREMTRFVMSPADAVKLVLDSASQPAEGQIFVTKMPSIYICDLAHILLKQAGRSIEEIRLIGPQAGEKMFEELLNTEEVRRSYETDNFIVILPPGETIPETAKVVTKPYNSEFETKLSEKELQSYLIKNELI